jgi:hypothetical protein
MLSPVHEYYHRTQLSNFTTSSTDATAGFSNEQVNAGTNIIWPILVNHVLTVDEWATGLTKQSA